MTTTQPVWWTTPLKQVVQGDITERIKGCRLHSMCFPDPSIAFAVTDPSWQSGGGAGVGVAKW